MIRIVVCMDFDTDDPCVAYRFLRKAMNSIGPDCGVLGWESSDEWYDDDGEPLSEREITSIVCRVIEEEVE